MDAMCSCSTKAYCPPIQADVRGELGPGADLPGCGRQGQQPWPQQPGLDGPYRQCSSPGSLTAGPPANAVVRPPSAWPPRRLGTGVLDALRDRGPHVLLTARLTPCGDTVDQPPLFVRFCMSR